MRYAYLVRLRKDLDVVAAAAAVAVVRCPPLGPSHPSPASCQNRRNRAETETWTRGNAEAPTRTAIVVLVAAGNRPLARF